MKPLSYAARKLIVDNANKLIAEATTGETRLSLFNSFSQLLIACGSYKGFNYSYWLDAGHTHWVKDGMPLDNAKYLGDQTCRRFY